MRGLTNLFWDSIKLFDVIIWAIRIALLLGFSLMMALLAGVLI